MSIWCNLVMIKSEFSWQLINLLAFVQSFSLKTTSQRSKYPAQHAKIERDKQRQAKDSSWLADCWILCHRGGKWIERLVLSDTQKSDSKRKEKKENRKRRSHSDRSAIDGANVDVSKCVSNHMSHALRLVTGWNRKKMKRRSELVLMWCCSVCIQWTLSHCDDFYRACPSSWGCCRKMLRNHNRISAKRENKTDKWKKTMPALREFLWCWYNASYSKFLWSLNSILYTANPMFSYLSRAFFYWCKIPRI